MMNRQNHNHYHQQQDQQSRAFYELSSLVLSLIRSPTIAVTDHQPPLTNPTVSATSRGLTQPVTPQITPSGFASLLLGVSMALMLCGSVAFFIGFMLMPWVIGLVVIFYFVGMVSYLSMLGRAILCHATAPVSSPKEIPSWKLL